MLIGGYMEFLIMLDEVPDEGEEEINVLPLKERKGLVRNKNDKEK